MSVIILYVRYYMCYTSSEVCTIMSDKFAFCQKVPFGRKFPFGPDFGNAASSMTRPQYLLHKQNRTKQNTITLS